MLALPRRITPLATSVVNVPERLRWLPAAIPGTAHRVCVPGWSSSTAAEPRPSRLFQVVAADDGAADAAEPRQCAAGGPLDLGGVPLEQRHRIAIRDLRAQRLQHVILHGQIIAVFAGGAAELNLPSADIVEHGGGVDGDVGLGHALLLALMAIKRGSRARVPYCEQPRAVTGQLPVTLLPSTIQ